jgi:hypothetical protein
MPKNQSDLKMSPPIPFSGRAKSAEFADQREYFAKISKQAPRDKDFERAFIQSKFHLMLTHPTLGPAERKLAVSELAERLGKTYPDALAKYQTAPVPGGVGYGVYYNNNFKMAFATGTSVYFEVVCPTTAGGNVNDFLYLTAMNRAAKGVEAFLSYWSQDPFRFMVFDWARSDQDPWVLDIPFDQLASYVDSSSAHGTSYATMGIMNTTYEVSPGTWRNEAWLWNVAAGRWDLMYGHEYTASQYDEASGYNGSWGPIVETFQSLYLNTKSLDS